MKKHIKFIAYAIAGFMAISAINVPNVYAKEAFNETVEDTTAETSTDSATDTGTETPENSDKDESKTNTEKQTQPVKKQTVKIAKYKKNKKLYVKKKAKAYKVTKAGKLKTAKSLKKSTKVTVVGIAKVKKVKYYVIKSGKNTLLVKQSLLSKTKPKAAKPSSKPSTNSSNGSSNSSSKHPTPQNNTPSGYKEPTNQTVTSNTTQADIKKVKIVNGKIEYRDIDGKIKYAKYQYGHGDYEYWYTMKDGRGFWIWAGYTDLSDWSQDDLEELWWDQNANFE